MDPTSWPCFRFIRISVVSLVVSLGKADGLAIGRAVSIEVDVIVDFFGLFL